MDPHPERGGLSIAKKTKTKDTCEVKEALETKKNLLCSTPSKTLEEQCMSWRINISTSPRQPQKKLEIPLAGSRWMWLGLPSRLHPLCLSRAFHPYVREQDRKKGGPTARGRRDRTVQCTA